MATIRPDLQSAEFSRPAFLTDTILPPLMKEQIAGTLYYQKVLADNDAQTGREHAATIGTINEHIVAAATKTFSCEEIRDRQKMSYTQVKGYADLLHAELAMARLAKRAWFNQIETKTALALFGGDALDVSGTSADIPTDIENAVAELQDKAPGKIALVLSSRNFTKLKTNESIKDRMKNTGVVVGAGGDPRMVTAEQLAAILGVDQLLIGPNDVWYNAMKKDASSTGGSDGYDYQGNAALVVLPEASTDPVEEIQLGRTIYYKWSSDGDFYVCESYHEDKVDADCVDVKGLVDSQILNSDLFKTVTLF